MDLNASVKAKRLRTWSSLGNVRRMPSEYEIGSHDLNPSTRNGRSAALEINPSTPVNLWFMTYRDKSPLQVEDWHQFRDPDEMMYRKYVSMQEEEEAFINGALDEYSEAEHDRQVSDRWTTAMGTFFVPTRFLIHGLQMCQMYIAGMAPSSYITYVSSFSAGDLLRRGSLVAYRTKQMELARPELELIRQARRTWVDHPNWQPARRLIEQALIAYDWAESFAALNLVIRPALEELLVDRLAQLARDNGDELTWLLLMNLSKDSERAMRWSAALSKFAIDKRPENQAVLKRWVDQWRPRVELAVQGIAEMFATLPEMRLSVSDAVGAAAQRLDEMWANAGLITKS